MKKINGKVDPILKPRINWIQEYIDKLTDKYEYVPKDVITALYQKKNELVEMV